MNVVLWVLQILTGLMYASSAVMKLFMFDKVSQDVQSFGALPKKVWMTLGIVELISTLALIVPSALQQYQFLTVLAATVLAVESVVFIWVHARYRETGTIIVVTVLGLVMAFIAYGRSIVPA